jgi:hypothetical protein
MMRVKLRRDFSSRNPLFTNGAIGESDLNTYTKFPWVHLRFIDVAINGQHLDVVDDWTAIEIVDERYWEQLAKNLRSSEKISLAVDGNGAPRKLTYANADRGDGGPCTIRDREKIKQIIDLCRKYDIRYDME